MDIAAYINFPVKEENHTPIMQQIGIDRTPHCCRHTCISLLSEAGIQDTTIKKIVGYSGAMALTERVYTHLDVQILVDAINKICIMPDQEEYCFIVLSSDNLI